MKLLQVCYWLKPLLPCTRQPRRALSLESGVSLISVMIGLVIATVLALGVSKTITDGMAGQKKVEIDSELTYVKQVIRERLDCKATLDAAVKSSGSASIQDLCNKKRAFTLLGAKSTITGQPKVITDNEGKIGQWLIRATCEFDKSLIIAATRISKTGAVAKDPLNGKTLSAQDNARLNLYGPTPPQMPICFSDTMGSSSLGLVGVDTGFVGRPGQEELRIEAPTNAKVVEIEANGQFTGGGDVGADTVNGKIIVNLENGTYQGTQMVKIGSDAKKARSIFWKPTKIGQTPAYDGFVNGDNKKWNDWQDKKFPNPMIRDGGAAANGKRVLFYSDKVNDPGKKNDRWWAESVTMKYYGE